MPRAAEWNSIAESYNSGAIGASGYPGRRLPESSGLVYVKNNSGSDRLRWDCMTLGNTTETIGNDGNELIVFAATTASSDGTPVILQEPIAAGLLGVGRIFGQTLAKLATASDAGHLNGTPNASGHNLTPGADGPIKILSAPSTGGASVRPVLLGAAARNEILIKTPGGGIAAATGTGPYTFGSATCTVVSDAGVVGSETVTVKNIVNEAIAANVIGKASRVGSIWVIDVASCS
jgi:hypothetical protein